MAVSPPLPQAFTSPRTLSATAKWLDRQPRAILVLWAVFAAFTTYACMYAFRKPFTAAGFGGLTVGRFDYKTVAVLGQLLGYMLSKFIGIKVASEAKPWQRAAMILAFIGIAELALVFVGLVPPPWNVFCLFVNGLPIGMVWGLVFGFLEGRRVSEFLILGLSVSVIFSSGWVKAVGKWVMESGHANQFWMPAVTGAMFIPLLLLAVWMLSQLPPPDAKDIEHHSKRQPMDKAARRLFLRQHGLGVVLLTVGYMCFMAYRDLRDSFQVNIMSNLGVEMKSEDFANWENLVGLAVIVGMIGLWFFRGNRAAVIANVVLISFGAISLGLLALLFEAHKISPKALMIGTGIGLYLAYVPFQSILYDRLIAGLRTGGTAVFLMALGDSFGYLSSVGLYLYQKIFPTLIGYDVPQHWSDVFLNASKAMALFVPLVMTAALLYFLRHIKERTQPVVN